MMIVLLGFKLPVSYVTIAAAVILLISLIIGIRKGFLKSVFSVVEWIGAIIGSVFGMPYASNFIMKQAFVEKLGAYAPKIVSIASFVLVFLLVFVVLKIICSILNKMLSSIVILAPLNKFLGAIFKVAVGFLIIIIITYLLNMFSGVSFVKTIIDNAQTDPFSKWLFSNNLIDKLLQMLSGKVPAIGQFLDTLQNFAVNATK